jgi:hypothetical protein
MLRSLKDLIVFEPATNVGEKRMCEAVVLGLKNIWLLKTKGISSQLAISNRFFAPKIRNQQKSFEAQQQC